MIVGQKPDPKDFANYEDYKEALEVYNMFEGMNGEVEKIIHESHSDEEFENRMHEMGFQKFDETVIPEEDREHMHQMLFQAELFTLQEDFNDLFFGKLLPEDQKFLPEKVIKEASEENIPGIPLSWTDDKTIDGKAALFFLKCSDFLFEKAENSNQEIKEFFEDKKIQRFGRSLYMLTREVLKFRKPNPEDVKRIRNFGETEFSLNKEDKKIFLERLEEISK